MRRSFLFLLLGMLLAPAQIPNQRQGMSYEEETPPNLQRFSLRRFEGLVLDRDSQAIPTVALGLYTDAAPHKLIGVNISGDKGSFDFGKDIPPGDYRLIAKYPGLCTANIPLHLDPLAKRGLHFTLRMEYPGLQVCSYAEVK